MEGMLTFCAFAFVIYIVIPFIILKIKGPTEGRNKGEELLFIVTKIGFFFYGLMLIDLIIKLLFFGKSKSYQKEKSYW